MKKVHKWAEEIAHFVNGGDVERKLRDDDDWCLVDHLSEFQLDQDLEIRIAPYGDPMKVYSVSFGRDDEPGSIDCIFQSLESAIAHKENFESKRWGADWWVEIEVHNVQP